MSIDRVYATLYTIGAKINMQTDGLKNIHKEKETQVPFWQPGLLMFSRMSGWIIGPVVLAILLGKWLDRRYDTEPWLFLATVAIAFVISMVGLVKDALKEIDKLNKSDKEKS